MMATRHDPVASPSGELSDAQRESAARALDRGNGAEVSVPRARGNTSDGAAAELAAALKEGAEPPAKRGAPAGATAGSGVSPHGVPRISTESVLMRDPTTGRLVYKPLSQPFIATKATALVSTAAPPPPATPASAASSGPAATASGASRAAPPPASDGEAEVVVVVPTAAEAAEGRTLHMVDGPTAGMHAFSPDLARLLQLCRVLWRDVRTDAPRTIAEVARRRGAGYFGPNSPEVERLCIMHTVLHPRPVATAPSTAPTLVLRTDIVVPPPPSRDMTSQAIEAAKRERAVDMLVASLPAAAEQRMLGFTAMQWAKVPDDMRTLLRRRCLTSFSAGQLDSCRRALARLHEWLDTNDLSSECEGFQVSGGVLSWFVLDLQSVSRSSGQSIPNSLRSGLTFAATHLSLPLEVKLDSFQVITAVGSATPKAALSATVAILYHFETLVAHTSAVVSYYASGFVLCILAALRVRDAQRATVSIEDERVSGLCYTSKHPKRRTPKKMPFFTPRRLPFEQHSGMWALPLMARGDTFDYIFPRVQKPRGASILHPRVSFREGPASSSYVITMLRMLLTLPPLSLSEADAKEFSGHSLRHCMPSLARALGLSREDRDELGRWIAQLDSRVAGEASRTSLSNRYSEEAAPQRVVRILNSMLDAASRAVAEKGGISHFPAKGGWDMFNPDHMIEPLSLSEARGDIDGECSSSGSDTDLCDEDEL